MSSGSAFELLHRGLQEQLWKMGWPSLRPLQVEAIHHILGKPNDVILEAATAAGKTEAAFLPILSQLAADPKPSVQAMYVGPLKALINDQFVRVEELCSRLELPVFRWHGDVGAQAKARMIEAPAGVLLITPESLESLFINRSYYLRKIFGHLRFVVIDELHSFLANERGLHLRSLLYRLRACVEGQTLRHVGLSATIGDPAIAQRYLNCRDPASVLRVCDSGSDKELKLRLHAYRECPVSEGQEETEVPEHVKTMAEDLVKHTQGSANLIFANAKMLVEECADLCQRIAQERHLPGQYLVHHGSLAAEIREETESTMKSGHAATTFCSSTLEMGIDIGSVKMVGQIGAPWSVSSLAQRVGRSGRRSGEARILRMYIQCRDVDDKSNLFDRLHLELIQAIAVAELMLQKQIEPPSPPVCDLSTLTQQILSVIAQKGAASAQELHHWLCRDGAFVDIEPTLFAQLLRQLAAEDLLEQTAEGPLILGLKGEAIRKDRGFYAVFKTASSYTVIHAGRNIGTVDAAPEVDEHLLFAGRRWLVVDVDEEHLEIHVRPAKGHKLPKFSGSGGEVHQVIRDEMKTVLFSQCEYVYLDPVGKQLLSDARMVAARASLATTKLLPLGSDKTAIMTWAGSRTHQTLDAMLRVLGMNPGDEVIALVVPLDHDDTVQTLRSLMDQPLAPEAVARVLFERRRRKYDEYLGEDLLDTSLVRGWLDMDGAQALIRSIIT